MHRVVIRARRSVGYTDCKKFFEVPLRLWGRRAARVAGARPGRIGERRFWGSFEAL